jgi:DNA-directed RNA polymerase specialized sigma24 family protein
VAKLLGVPLGTVKSRTSIALKSLSTCVRRCTEGGSHG